MPMKFRDEKIESALSKLAAEFIVREASPASLITVTNIIFEDRSNRATIFVSVLPDSEAEKAIAFLNRKRSALQDYMQKHIRMRSIPYLFFSLDKGEKNRQLLDSLDTGSDKENPTDKVDTA